MMARSTTLQHKAGYIDRKTADRQLFKIFLLRTAGPYIWVNRYPKRDGRVTSVYPSISDMTLRAP